MVRVEVFEDIAPEWWNSLVKSVPEGTIFQSTYWGDYLKAKVLRKPFYLVSKNTEGEIVSILLAWIERFDPASYLNSLFCRFINPIINYSSSSYGYCLYGPLIFKPSDSHVSINEMIDKLEEIAKRNRLLAFRRLILPLCYNNTLLNGLKDIDNILTKRGFLKERWATIHINLRSDLNILWRNLKNSARKAIKKCKTQHISVEFLKKEELSEYEHLIKEMSKRIKEPLPPHYPDHFMWKYLRGGDKHFMEVFVAKQDGKILSALGILLFNGIIFEIASVQSSLCAEKKIYVGDLIKWEIIKWGHLNKYKFYDLCGISPEPRTSKEKGIRQFKEKWGGTVVNYHNYSKIYRKYQYYSFTQLKKIFNLKKYFCFKGISVNRSERKE